MSGSASASPSNAEATQPPSVARRYPVAPLVGVAAAVFNDRGEVLLAKRGRPPGKGNWGLPGGLLDVGERLVDGARREVWEECAVQAEIHEVVATYEPIVHDSQGCVEYHYVVIDFWATYLAGEAVAQDDAAAVAWVCIADLSQYALATETLEVIHKAYTVWQHNPSSD